ncbi:hypothetical protein AM571_CH02433 [Rhizobium etli 8C-3]|uniref:Uncharacterized protein n=1 Tax=Rhizobium etli 8C-3 TaxID=538025 RepID=A0A1L5P531_RHIET|nr:hypothetical protein AM571_CH02433 [Rhizobium etli 8C-3]
MVAAFMAVAAGCGAEPFRRRSSAGGPHGLLVNRTNNVVRIGGQEGIKVVGRQAIFDLPDAGPLSIGIRTTTEAINAGK